MANVRIKMPPEGATPAQLVSYLQELAWELEHILSFIDENNLAPLFKKRLEDLEKAVKQNGN